MPLPAPAPRPIPPPPLQRPLPTPLVLAYYDGGGVGSLGWRSLVAQRHVLTGIVPDWYQIWANGAITGTPDPGVLAFARRQGMWVFALVQQNAHPQVFGTLLGSLSLERAAIFNLLRVCHQGYDGVNLDFEGIAPADRQAFTRFVGMAAAALHRQGYYLTLSVPAKTQDQPDNAWTGAYDYRALGKEADLLMPMAYDQHSQDGPPGAVCRVYGVPQQGGAGHARLRVRLGPARLPCAGS
jgi:spore germination protein